MNVKLPRFLDVAGEGVEMGDSLEAVGGEATVVSSEAKAGLDSSRTFFTSIYVWYNLKLLAKFILVLYNFDDNLKTFKVATL